MKGWKVIQRLLQFTYLGTDFLRVAETLTVIYFSSCINVCFQHLLLLNIWMAS